MYHQFSKYVKDKVNGKNIQKRDTEDKSESEKIQLQMQEFLRDVYPGMKALPNQLVELLTSPDPYTTLTVKANLNPEDERCNESTPSTDEQTVPNDNKREKESEDAKMNYRVATVSSEKCCKQLCQKEMKEPEICLGYNWKQHEGENGNQCILKHKLSVSGLIYYGFGFK